MNNCVIALASDKNYLTFVFPLIRDIKKFVNPCPSIYLFYDGPIEDLNELMELALSINVDLHGIDIRKELESDLHNTIRYLTRTTFTRLYIPKHLEGVADRVLYLDIDLLVIGDFSFVFSMAMTQTIAAVTENFDSMNIAFGTYNFAYFNAGVLLIDVVKWNSQKILDETTSVLEKKGPFNCQDQDALNLVFQNSWQVLPPTMNVMISSHDHSLDLPQLGNPLIVHFVGPHKPWQKPAWTRWHAEWLSRNHVYLEEIGYLVENKPQIGSGRAPNQRSLGQFLIGYARRSSTITILVRKLKLKNNLILRKILQFATNRRPLTHSVVGFSLRFSVVRILVRKLNLKNNTILRKILRLPKWSGDL
jgi:lipopolysaccharide biosynthesis glycosyltransferase